MEIYYDGFSRIEIENGFAVYSDAVRSFILMSIPVAKYIVNRKDNQKYMYHLLDLAEKIGVSKKTYDAYVKEVNGN